MSKRTGFTPKQVAQLRERDGNRCAWTGQESDRLVPQHRGNRGMGGSPKANRLSNGVLIDSIINGQLEADPDMQAEATRRGIKISSHADPRLIPVQHAVHGEVWLTDDGRALDTAQTVPF